MTANGYPRRLALAHWMDPIALTGSFLTLVFVAAGVVGPIFVGAGANSMHVNAILLPPGHGRFFLGTDQYGRDLLSRILVGIRVSIEVAFSSITVAALVGSALGTIAGYAGGALDMVVMRVLDIVMAFPAILLAILVMAILGSTESNVILAIALVYVPMFARVARGSVMQVREEEFVQASVSLGATDRRIVVRHILPNALNPVVVQYSLSLSQAVLTEAALSYLGLGVHPPTPSLGSLISLGQQFMLSAPWLAIYPGLAILIGALGFNLAGDFVRDRLGSRDSMKHDVGAQP